MKFRLKHLTPICSALLGLLLVALLDFDDRREPTPKADEPGTPATKRTYPAGPVAPASAQPQESKAPLPNIDLRLDRVGRGEPLLPLPRINALAKLKQQFPGLAVDFDAITKSPKWIGSNRGLLSGPQAALAAKDADAPVRQFIDAHREVFGHGSANLDSARRVTDYTAQPSGSRKVVWHQQLDGIDIFEAVFQANLTANAELINVGSHLMADPQTATGNGGRANLLAQPPVTVEQAVAAAGQNVGEKVILASVRPEGPPAAQPDRRQQFRAAMLTDAEAKLVWVPMDAATLNLAWDVTVTSRTRGEMYRVLVDAKTGGVLVRQALTAYLSDATYRVYTTESPTPFSPGHEKPSSLQPASANRVLLTTPALNVTASPNGWINDGNDTTNGNNTDTYTDTNADNIADLPLTQGAGRVFDFPMDLTQAPSTYKDASVTQLFYWTNFAHDRLYQLGFTEAAGNFQLNNFGRGGAGNDPVNAEAQDGLGTNNANFSTPVDGGRGRMQMYNWTSATPGRDGSFEAEVVLHEYGHGLSNRLVGGPSVTITALSSQGMGEGWSDFYGLALTAEATDNPHGNWAPAAYVRYLASGSHSENYYYGIRRYSYSTDMLKNPHTFRDIDPAQVDWHTSVPRNPLSAATTDATQVHYQGTVWCTILWDLRANLILKHGFATGNERALFLVTEGMKLGPANPNFVQARDGIVQATLVNHSTDLGEVWSAFAKRGLGDGATAPVSSTTTGLTESFTIPDSLMIDSRSGWNITGDKGGPFAPATKTVTLVNGGGSPLNWTANPNASWLSASPAGGSLAPGATVVVTVTTQANAMAAGSYSTNLVFSNSASGFNQPIGIRLYVTPPVAHGFDLSTNPGWTTTGEWAYGTPAGSGGTASGGSGNADPATGATGMNVFGVNLAGNQSTATAGPFYLTTPPIDLSARKSTRLRFQRWLNSNSLANTRVTVEVSTDGTSWREVFVNPGTVTADNAWTLMDYDISSIADQQAAVQVRWSYRTLVSGTAYSGWNIDDVQILGDPTAQFSLNIASTVQEGSPLFTGTVSINLPQPGPVTINLSSTDPTAATVPASILLGANEMSKTFTITPVNDTMLDGSQATVIIAAAANVASASRTLIVTDNEAAVLTLTAPATVTEGQVNIAGTVRTGTAPTRDIEVTLSSNNPALTVPATVTLPSGSTAAVGFSFAASDNAFAEGTKTVTLTASVPGWPVGTKNVNVTDNEVPTITLTGPATAREGDGPQSFTATVNTVQATNATLNLTSSDGTQLTVPPTVTIPAGQFSASFDAAIVDNALQDGTKSATITATRTGYANATRVVSIADNEVHHYSFAAIASPQKRNKPIAFAVTARDLNGMAITNHSGSLTMTTASPGGAVPFSSTQVNPFSNGTAAGSLIVTVQAASVTLTASDVNGKSGASNAFAVEPVSLDFFEWSGLPVGSILVDTVFNATVTAKDDQGATATSYNGSPVIEAYMPVFGRAIGSTSSTTFTTKIYNTAAHDSRAQVIYTAAELGATAGWIGSIGLSVAVPGGSAMRNFTLRMKHTDRESFDGGSWEESGWTTVYTSPSLSAVTPYFAFNLPFYFNGTQNIMLDVSFDNLTASTAGSLRYVASTGNRVLSGTSDSAHGDPLTWTSTTGPAPILSQELPTLQIYAARSYGPIPASPVTFFEGSRSVQAFAPTPSNAVVWLLATDPSGAFGFSNKVAISSPGPGVAGSNTLFSDDFETGTLGASWNLAGSTGATARTLVTTANTPKAGLNHLTMDTTSTATGTFARNSPTLTLDLAGRSNVSLEWFAKSFLDDTHLPVLTGPLGTFDSSMNSDSVAMSQDGVTWVEVAPLYLMSSTYGANATRVFLDPIIQRLGWTYNSSFRIRFSQYDDQAIPSDGIAIDNVAVKTNPPAAIALSLPPAITEGTLNVPVTVTLPSAPLTDTVVTLSSNGPARLTISASVTVLANQTTATALISAPQNQYADIGKGIIITATASGQITSYHNVRVVDDERPVLTLSLPPSIMEGSPSVAATVSITPLIPASVPVFLSSGNSAQATVTGTATISQGNPSAAISIAAINDTILDGTQAVTITASGDGLISGTGTINVLDNENAQLVLTPPAPLREGGAPGIGSVSISGPRPMATTVNLTSSDLTEATVNATATIQIGQTSANFQVFPVDDNERDGTQSALLTASATDLISATTPVQVRDNDPSFLEISTIASPQVRNAGIPVTIRAADGSGLTMTTFNGTVTLSAQANLATLPVTPSSPVTFTNGLWSGTVSIGAVGSGVALKATDSIGTVGTSNTFNVTAGGAATQLVFVPVASPQQAGAPISVQVFAADANGIRVNEVSGPVTVELALGPAGSTLASANLTLVNGVANTTFSVPLALPNLFLRATSASLAGQSSSFATTSPPRLIYPPLEVLFTDNFESGSFKPEWTITGTNAHRTIVTTAQAPRDLGHMVMDSSIDGSASRNEATLTLNLAGKSDVVLSFWMKEMSDEDTGPPASPFTNGADFDGVAISADGVSWYEVQPLRGSSISETYQLFTLNLSTLAASKGLSFTSAFKIRFNHHDDFAAPTDGFAFDDIRIVANAVSPPEPTFALFQDDFETGVFKPEWQLTGTGNQRTIITGDQTPRGQFHLVMDANPVANSRNEATLTLDLTGLHGVFLNFWMKENFDEDHAPPTNPFADGADFDGVAISTDGTTWYEVQPLLGTSSTETYNLFNVDLDAAIATHGLTYNANFKIRFNHYDNSPWTGGDGFAFDDISVTTIPSNELQLTFPATLTEGGTASASLAITTPRDVDTVVTLQSNRPASLLLPATVTIAAGTTVSAAFNVTAIENTLLIGSLPVEILATAQGVRQKTAALSILDNDQPASFVLTLPGTLAEGDAINGSVAISPIPLFDLPVSLTATSAFGLAFPATLVIPAGSASAGFTITRAENTGVLEPASTLFTAALSVANASQTILLPDNDTAGPLVITMPDTVLESAGLLAGTVGFAPPQVAGRDIVVSLGSSATGSLTVPATVTIPAGQGVASFNATIIDNALQDGARAVTITASAASLTGSALNITVHDNELHHVAFAAVASPQVALRPFDLILRGQTIDNQPASITGTASLTAASGATPVPLNVTTATAFINGVSTTPITISSPFDSVIISATTATGGLTANSNAFNVEIGPRLAISPNPLTVSTPAGEPETTHTLTLTNSGTSAANWSAEAIYASFAVPPLTSTLTSLNSTFASINALIPSRYDFTDGVTGYSISDGGGDMYDGGNYLDLSITSATNTLTYSDNIIVTSANLGAGGQYFTRKYPGLFILAADVASLDHFRITGNLGADGSGNTDSTILTSVRTDGIYKGFVKRVYGAGKPSVNHLIIIKDNGAATHSAATDTNDDAHSLSNLSGVTRLYYLLYASSSGGFINDSQTQAIMEAFLNSLGTAAWLSITPAAGAVPAGGNAPATVNVDTAFLSPGAYDAKLRFTSNDASAPAQDVPVNLTVMPAVHHFGWSPIPSPQAANVPFSATVTALDSTGALAPSFNGSADLRALGSLNQTTSGTGASYSSYPFYGYYLQSRLQNIYLPAEVGPAGRLQSLAINIGLYSGIATFKNFIVRVKHTSKTGYTTTANSTWETDGWMTVYNGTVVVSAAGWQELPCAFPFDYDGVSNLMVDCSFDDELTDTVAYSYSTTRSPNRSLYSTVPDNTSPLTWQGNLPQGTSSSVLQNIRFTSQVVVPVSPATVSFTNGSWSGSTSVQSAGTSLALRATHAAKPTVVGESNSFNITSVGVLSIAAPGSATEGGTLNATVSANPAPASDMIVTLASNNATEVTLPATVTILAGQSSASFTVSLADDALLEGNTVVSISAAAPNYQLGTTAINVTDNETTLVTVMIPATIAENGAVQPAGGLVTLGTVAAADLTVLLTSSDTTELSVPSSVTIPMGQTSVAFALIPRDDSLLDGEQAVTVTAALPSGGGAGSKIIIVTDSEARTFSFTYSYNSRSESAGTISSTGTIYLTGAAVTPIVITLTSSDTTEILDTSITIPAGSSSGNYSLTMVDDGLQDGTQVVTMTASSPSFTNNTFTFSVMDDELHNFQVTVTTPQVRGGAFNATFRARDINNDTITTYNGSPLLTAKEGAKPLSITPSSTSGFSSGVRTQSMTVLDLASAAVLTATDPVSGSSGSSSPFVVGSGPLDHFNWESIPPVDFASAQAPFSVSLSARDIYENVATSHTATAQLSAVMNYNTTTTAGYLSSSGFPYMGSSPKGRCQMIYLPAEAGATSRTLRALAFNVTSAPFNLPSLTIRLKHTTKSSFSGSAVWEATGWTTVFTGSITMINQTGWRLISFTTPFDYNGADNLMVDVVTNGSSSNSVGISSTYSNVSGRVIYNSSSSSGDPVTWTGTSPSPFSVSTFPDLRLFSYQTVPMTPAQTGTFAAGFWTGELSVSQSASQIRLLAVNDTSFAISEPFNIFGHVPVPVLAAEPVFTGGLSNQLAWTGVDGLEVNVQQALTGAFQAPVNAPWSSAGTSSFGNLTDGTGYHYRAKSRVAGPVPAAKSWTQTDNTTFQTSTLVFTDATTLPGSVRLAKGYIEEFEGAASDWSDTVFSNRSAGTFIRGANTPFVPVTTPQLPISADSDKEGEMTANDGYAMMAETPANTFGDCSITSHIYLRDPNNYSNLALLARASGSGASLNGYKVSVHYFGYLSLPIVVGLDKITNGVSSPIITTGTSSSFIPSLEHFKVQLSITGSTLVTKLWKVSVISGVVTETLVDTRTATDSTYTSGVCGLLVSKVAVFEDVRILGTTYFPSGAFTSPVITPPLFGRWSTFDYHKLTPAGSTLTVDVLDASSNVLVTNVGAGTDLNTLPSVASQSSIRLRANLATADNSVSSELLDWTVSWIPETPLYASAWSNTVSSTQDAAGPIIDTTELTTTSATAAIIGTAVDSSGVASLTVAGAPSITVNGFANWGSNPIADLVDGPNPLTIIAADKAVPPNTSTLITTVYRIATPDADPGRTGIISLLRHAYGIPADAATPLTLLPAASAQTSAQNGKRYLTLDYRRRIQRKGLIYAIETSGDLTTWNGSQADISEQSVTPTGDGITEVVRVRVTPAMTDTNAKFIRMRVHID